MTEHSKRNCLIPILRSPCRTGLFVLLGTSRRVAANEVLKLFTVLANVVQPTSGLGGGGQIWHSRQFRKLLCQARHASQVIPNELPADWWWCSVGRGMREVLGHVSFFQSIDAGATSGSCQRPASDFQLSKHARKTGGRQLPGRHRIVR